MSSVEWIAAAADFSTQMAEGSRRESVCEPRTSHHGLQPNNEAAAQEEHSDGKSQYQNSWELERVRRIYRGRTVAMLRRYMRYSIETGRLHIHPHAADVDESSKEEDCLAKTLLDRLGIPASPVVADEYEKEANEVIPVKVAGNEEAEKVDQDSAVEESSEVTVAGE